VFHLGRATLFADPPPIRFASTLPTFDINAVADLAVLRATGRWS
jgi:hypothetical protein